MKFKYYVAITILIASLVSSCGEEPPKVPSYLQQKYLGIEEFNDIVDEINLRNRTNKPLFAYNSPEFQKMIDQQNLLVIVEDEAVGLSRREHFATANFDLFKGFINAYSATDRQDKLIYPLEYVSLEKHHLFVQLHYFRLGNESILQSADDPESSGVKKRLLQNGQILVGNFTLYLDDVKQENAMNDEAIGEYASGIDIYFPKMYEQYPDANYSKMITKIKNMQKKAQTPALQESLQNLHNMLVPPVVVDTISADSTVIVN